MAKLKKHKKSHEKLILQWVQTKKKFVKLLKDEIPLLFIDIFIAIDKGLSKKSQLILNPQVLLNTN